MGEHSSRKTTKKRVERSRELERSGVAVAVAIAIEPMRGFA